MELSSRDYGYEISIIVNCDMADESFVCASKGGSWGLETCKKYVNVPVQYCPVTCKLCPGNLPIYTGTNKVEYSPQCK